MSQKPSLMLNLRARWLCSSRQLALAVVLAAASLISTNGGTFSTDFATDPGGVGLVNKPDISNIIEDGVLKLVDLADVGGNFGQLPLQGSYIFNAIDGDQKVASFTATFKARVGGGGTEKSSEGFSFVFADDLGGLQAPFREAGGASQGLVISFDTIDNAPDAQTEGNIPGEAPGIIVKLRGERVLFKRFDGLRTGDNFVPVEVKLDADGTLDVSYNGQKLIDNVGIPYAPIAGQFGFGAGVPEITSGSRDNFWIDDFSVTTATVTGAYILSASPFPFGSQPDVTVQIQIQDLGSGTVGLQFDDQTVAAVSSTVAGVTTVTYDPPGFLALGSSHKITLTYGGKTLTYSFKVVDVATLPPALAAAAGSVDTSKGGVKIRVYQVEAAQSDNSPDRAERQLAGQLGPNLADLSLANPDGTFDRDLVNMDQAGGEAGLFNATEGHPDEPIPGIPGSATNPDDNIAMEVTGFLELPVGVVTFGIVSDDAARLLISPDPRDVTGVRILDLASGTKTSSIFVSQAGLYPFRLLWTEGTGNAHLEFWTQTATGTRILVNDRATPSHIKAYKSRAAGFQSTPYVSLAKPGPGEANVQTTPKITLQITEESTTVNRDSIKLFLNGTQLALGAGAITSTGKVTTINAVVTDPLTAKAAQTLRLEFTDSAGRAVTREYSFITGRDAGGGLNAVKGYWTFDNGNLEAAVGRDMHFVDASLAGRYRFGTTAALGIPDIGGKPAKVVYVPFVPTDEGDIYKKIGLKACPNIAPNGGGTRVNQWTLIMDVLWGENSSPVNFGGVLQTLNLGGNADANLFWRGSDGAYGKNRRSDYAGIDPNHAHRRGEWARVVITVDLTASPRVFGKFVNGFKHRDDVIGDADALDSMFSLGPEIYLFADSDDNERTDCYVNAVQIREGRLTDEEVAALGGPSADGIPLPYSQWDFNGTLAATHGNDAQFVDPALANRYQFGTTTSFGIPDIGGVPAEVLHIPFVSTDEGDIYKKIGLRVLPGIAPNGGGTRANQWTLIMDVLWGENSSPVNFGGVLQTLNLGGNADANLFWRGSDGAYGKNRRSDYAGIDPNHAHRRGEWARVVITADLASSPRVFGKYVNGFKHRDDVIGDADALDSMFSLGPEVYLFADSDDNERTDCYVNSIQFRQGRMSAEEIAALGGPSALDIPTPDPVKGDWNFKGSLAATVGRDLRFVDPALAGRYQFGTTASLGIPDIGGVPVEVLHIPFVPTDEGDIYKKIGLRMVHNIPPNGGGTRVNQWTLIMDLLWGENSSPVNFGGVLQTLNLGGNADANLFWRGSDGAYGKNRRSDYAGIDPNHAHRRGEWARVVITADLASSPRVLGKYVNGFKHRDDVIGDADALDSMFSLGPEVYLFADSDDNERTDSFVSAIQLREGRLSDAEVAALGGPSPKGIPAAPTQGRASVRSVPAVEVFSSSSVAGPYTLDASAVINAATKSVTVPAPASTRFYRMRANTAVRIKNVAIQGGQLAFSYE